MGVYIGNINIPFVSEFSVDKIDKPIEVIKHLGDIPPHVAEFQADVLNAIMNGTLFQASGDVRNVDQYAEDLDALVDRSGVHNFIHEYQDRSGWLVLSSADSPKSADSVLIRQYSLSGRFMPKNKYQTRMHTAPAILTNDFSFVLGTDDCDNYVALPIGATHIGGDGITTTRTAEDGTIEYILATSDNDIKFDISEDDIDNGELKIWDEMNEVSESNWVKIFNPDHVFTGDIIIQNGLYRLWLDPSNNYITVYYWGGASYTKIDDFKSGTYSNINFNTINPDIVSVELDSGITIDMVRGHPPQIDTGDADLMATSISLSDQSTSTENYLSLGSNLHICSNTSFSIIGGTKNLDNGKKWIYYETDATIAEDVAHQAMIDPNTKRELISRSPENIIQYGITWNESADTYNRTGALTDIATGVSPGNTLLPIQSRMRRCVINDSGVVQYYLDPTDSTQKEGGGAANLDGSDGQVMVEIPAFYYRYLYAGTTHLWEISPVAKTGFNLHPAFIKNGANVAYRYIGAYEGSLYDASATRYTNGLQLVAGSTDFVNATSAITRVGESHPFSLLEVGDKIVVAGTTNNNGTFTVATAGDQTIIVSEALVQELTVATATIETEKDFANDILCSVSAKAPINDLTRANGRTIAAKRGTGWRQQDYDLISAIQLLYLVEYADFYSQSMIGNGLTDWLTGTWNGWNAYNPIETNGNSNSDGDATANTSGGNGVTGSYMSYRGIENFYGHIWKWVDGININNNIPYVSNTDTQFTDDTTTNYTDLGVTLHNADGWQNTLEQISRGFLPASVGASSSTKITDYYYQSSGWRVVFLGGFASVGTSAGAFCMAAYSASSNVNRTFGVRLAF